MLIKHWETCHDMFTDDDDDTSFSNETMILMSYCPLASIVPMRISLSIAAGLGSIASMMPNLEHGKLLVRPRENNFLF